MSRTIHVELSQKGIARAINEIEEYKRELNGKIETLINRLSEIGLNEIKYQLTGVWLQSYTKNGVAVKEPFEYTTSVKREGNNGKYKATINFSGDKVLFIEFSAGITYGIPGSAYPLSSGSGFGVGTYPGQRNAKNYSGWLYKSDSGEVLKSYGNKAYMPMYHADMEIQRNVASIAKEVFG